MTHPTSKSVLENVLSTSTLGCRKVACRVQDYKLKAGFADAASKAGVFDPANLSYLKVLVVTAIVNLSSSGTIMAKM